MQTEIDLSDAEVTLLDRMCAARHISREELLSEAVKTFLLADRKAIDGAFGLWAGEQGDGVEYQQRLRSEWDREWDR